ncbi:hypothetical protein DPMN_009865 [Dreissena polymorpha]|uniref:Uncharacterized protein n=1 Tax=Dreissena polymorpha TaxID=45954 RepID=A0A9D4N322_DREPO|nr:hypothetical protein DPMN_009865 [Dreissena polymorpha]
MVRKVLHVDTEDEDIEMTFLQQSKDLFRWPRKEDKIWIDFTDVICQVSEPVTTGRPQRTFKLAEEGIQQVNI